MYTVSAAVRAAISGGHQPLARISALEADRSVRATWEQRTAKLLGGSTTYDRSREVRRTCSAELENADGGLSPRAATDYFAKGQRFRAESGVILGSTAFWMPMFEGIVSAWTAGMRGRLSVSGEDPLSLLQQPFGTVVSLDATLTGEEALRVLWEPVLGHGSGWTLDAGGRTVGAVRSYLESDDRLSAGVALAKDLGCEVFADRNGLPLMRPVPDPSALPITAAFTTLPRVGNLIDGARSGTSSVYNRVITISDAPDRDPVRGQADITDPTSPFHADRIGLRVAPLYRSAQLVTQEQANTVAANLLVQYVLFQDASAYTAVPDPTVDEGDAATFTEPVSGAAAAYWLSQVVHPLVHGTMSVSGPLIVPVFA